MAITLTDQGEITWASFPIEKVEHTEDGNVMVWGKATDDSVDSDLQIVDPDFAAKAIQEWMDTGPNIRVQHQHDRDPAGVGISVSRDGNAHWVKSKVIEPVAKQLVIGGALRAYSVGIARPTIQRDALARGGRITDGQIVEISLVDRPANKNCGIQLVKAADDGTAVWVGKAWDDRGLLTKDESTEDVTVTLPADVHVGFSPADLSRILKRKNSADKDVTTSYHGGVPGGSMPKADDDADAEKEVTTRYDGGVPKADDGDAAEKRDFDPNVGGGVDRDKIPAADFAGRDRSFPIVKPGDVSDALQSIGRAGPDNYSPGKLRSNILRIARRKGFPVPDSARKPKKDKAAVKAAAQVAVAALPKKDKVTCQGCGAMQNVKHAHCTECGKPMGGAPAAPVEKNHDFQCLACGTAPLDKGEQFCPKCGTANPGYMPEADQKIPANADKASRRSVAEKAIKTVQKGKKMPADHDPDAEKCGCKACVGPDMKKGKKGGKKKPFGGNQAPPFGKDSDDDSADKTMDAPVTRPKAAKKSRSEGSFGHSPVPTAGVTGMESVPVPAHREPDGPGVASLEHSMGLPTDPVGDSGMDPQFATIMRLKSVGIDTANGFVHDLVCPAYTWDDVQKSYPGGMEGFSAAVWQAKALEAAASAPLDQAKAASQLGQAAYAIKSAPVNDLIDVKTDINKAFQDANPGPGTFPVPSKIDAQRYNRPYINAGHSAPSHQQQGPNSAPVPPSGDMAASHYTHGFLHDGRSEDSPANKSGAPYPQVTGVPVNLDYSSIHKTNILQAFSAMHSHFDRVFPGVCPMNGDAPAAHPLAPAQKQEDAVTKSVSPDGMTGKARKKLKAKLTRQVMKGKMPLDEARIKMGKKPKTSPMPLSVPKGSSLKRKDIQKAVSVAMSKSEKKNRKDIARLTSLVNALADQPDPQTQAFKGMAMEHPLRKSAAPAGVREVSDNAARTQAMILRELENEARNSPDPARREAAWAAVVKAKGLTDLIS